MYNLYNVCESVALFVYRFIVCLSRYAVSELTREMAQTRSNDWLAVEICEPSLHA